MSKHILFLLLVITFAFGCATTQEKEIVFIPKEVKVSVYRSILLDLPAEPVYEVCTQLDIRGSVQCIGRNVMKLQHYSEELRAVIEANNAAAKEPPSTITIDLNKTE